MPRRAQSTPGLGAADGIDVLIVQRYLLREVGLAFGAVFAVLLLIYVSNRFVRYLAQAAAGDISPDIVFTLLFYKMIANSVLLLPLALFIAILMALGRLQRDSEIVAMSAGGIGDGKLAIALFWVSVAGAAVTAVMALEVAPRVATLEAELLERSRADVQMSGIFPGRFQDFSGGDQVIYAERLEPGRQTLARVFARAENDGTENVLTAERAYLSLGADQASRYIVLENGYRYTGLPGRVDYAVTRFARHALLLGKSEAAPGYRRLETLASERLLELGKPEHIAELQWRISMPLTMIVLTLMAVPLSHTSPRQGRFLHLFTAILIYFLYTNGIGVAQKLVEREQLSALVGVWAVHALALLAVAALSLRQPSVRWWLGQRVARFRRRA